MSTMQAALQHEVPRHGELPAAMAHLDRYAYTTSSCFDEPIEDLSTLQRHAVEGKYAHKREFISPEEFDQFINRGLARAAKNEKERRDGEKKLAHFKTILKKILGRKHKY
jgi:hypothetical protein